MSVGALDGESRDHQAAPEPAGPECHLSQARFLLESAAGVAVVTAALYLLGVVHERAFFSRFGIRPLYLDGPPSLYVFRGAPAVATVIVLAYWVFLLRAFGEVIGDALRRGPRAALRSFFLPTAGEVRNRREVVPFIAARLVLVLLALSPSILISSSSFVLRLDLDGLSLTLAFVFAVCVVWRTNVRGALLRQVPKQSRQAVERLLIVGTVLGLAVLAAHRTGEQAAWAMVTGYSNNMVQARLQFWPEVANALPNGDYFAVLMTDDNDYVLQPECPPPERPHVFAVPRTNVASAALWSAQPTPVGTPTVPAPDWLVPRGFCWDLTYSEDVAD